MAIEAGCWRHQTAKRAACVYQGIPLPLIARRTWPSARHAGAGGAAAGRSEPRYRRTSDASAYPSLRGRIEPPSSYAPLIPEDGKRVESNTAMKNNPRDESSQLDKNVVYFQHAESKC